VEGKDGGREQPREIGGVFGRATYNGNSLCYNNQKQEVKCSKKKGIIVGSVIGTLFIFFWGIVFVWDVVREAEKAERILGRGRGYAFE